MIKKFFTLRTQEGVQIASSFENSWSQWIALLLGVLSQPFFSFYSQNGNIVWGQAYSNWEFLLFSVIVSIVLFPSLYRSTFDSERPKFLQVIPIFTAGLGWETMLNSAMEGVSKSSDQGIELTLYLSFIF